MKNMQEIKAEGIKAKDLSVGQHFWATLNGLPLVVVKLGEGRYDVCGPWECGVSSTEIEVVSLISVPRRIRNLKLYYE